MDLRGCGPTGVRTDGARTARVRTHGAWADGLWDPQEWTHGSHGTHGTHGIRGIRGSGLRDPGAHGVRDRPGPVGLSGG